MLKYRRPTYQRMTPSMPLSVGSEDSDTLIEEYLEWKKIDAPVAAKSYRVWVKRFQEFTNKAPEALTLGDWTAFANSLEGRFASKTRQFGLAVIHNYLRFWHEQGRLQFRLYLARIPKATAKSHNAIREDEYLEIVGYLKAKGDSRLRDLAIVMLLHDTGMRIGEALPFEFDQIEEDASAEIRTEKTTQKRRVFWSPQTDNVIQRLIVQRVNSGAKSDWLFVSSRGNDDSPLDRRTVQRMMRDVTRELGLKRRLSPHSFRHAFIHRLAQQGVPDAVIAQLVGHGSPHSISHYTKLSRPENAMVARRQFKEHALAA